MTVTDFETDMNYAEALAFVAHSLDTKESLIEHADDVIARLQELSAWMRFHLGPKDGIHEMLLRAVKTIQNAGYEPQDYWGTGDAN